MHVSDTIMITVPVLLIHVMEYVLAENRVESVCSERLEAPIRAFATIRHVTQYLMGSL